jgi:hypothetical protein
MEESSRHRIIGLFLQYPLDAGILGGFFARLRMAR